MKAPAVMNKAAVAFKGSVLGARSDDVAVLQALARQIGIRGMRTDGVNDFYTRRFCRMFQDSFRLGPYATKGLKVDDYAGPKTAEAVRLCVSNGLRCSENFSYREFLTPGSKTVSFRNEVCKTSRRFLIPSERLRADLSILHGRDVAVHWVSSYRDPAYNAALPGASTTSFHMRGEAGDPNYRLMPTFTEKQARDAGFTGVGVNELDGTVGHVDPRGWVARWVYRGRRAVGRLSRKKVPLCATCA